MEPIKSSELITNDDGSVFHLHLHPEDLAEQVILVGDPSRVEMIASYFEKIDVRKSRPGVLYHHRILQGTPPVSYLYRNRCG